MTVQHNCKEVKNLLKQLEHRGFSVSDKTKRGTVKITPPATIDGPIYFSHCTTSAIHQIRRDFAKLYKIKL